MAEQSREARVDEAMRFVNLVCGVLVAAVAIYAMVAWFVASKVVAMPIGPPLPKAIVYLGVAVALGLLVAAPLVYRKLLERAVVTARADERVDTAFESYRMATFLAFVLREGAAIVGLMLTLLTSQPMWCYALSALAVVAMIWGWPRRDDLLGLLAGSPAT